MPFEVLPFETIWPLFQNLPFEVLPFETGLALISNRGAAALRLVLFETTINDPLWVCELFQERAVKLEALPRRCNNQAVVSFDIFRCLETCSFLDSLLTLSMLGRSRESSLE